MELTFRAALPIDAEVVIPLIYSSGPYQFEYVFTRPPTTAQQFLLWAFVSGKGLFGYPIYTVALAGTRPVAIGAGYGRQEGKVFERQMVWQFVRFYGMRQTWRVIQRGLELDALAPFPEPGMYYIAQLGVAEAIWGQGIGTACLQHQITLARARGYQRCALDVASTNPRAQALYERMGFTVTQERAAPPAAATQHVPNIRRMELWLA